MDGTDANRLYIVAGLGTGRPFGLVFGKNIRLGTGRPFGLVFGKIVLIFSGREYKCGYGMGGVIGMGHPAPRGR